MIRGELGPGPVAQSDRELFEELYRSQWRRVRSFALSVLGPQREHLADDVAAETFVRLYRQLPSIRDRSSLVGYLQVTARRLAIDVMRKEQWAARAAAAPAELADDPEADPAQSVEVSERRAEVRRALDNLGAQERAVLVLLANGMSTPEIADACNIARASVLQIISRTRRQLRQAIDEGADPAPLVASRRPRAPTVSRRRDGSSARLSGRVLEVERAEFVAVAGELPGEPDLVVRLPTAAVAKRERRRLRPGVLFQWELETWSESDGAMVSSSRITLDVEQVFSPEQQLQIARRAEEIAAQLAGFSPPDEC